MPISWGTNPSSAGFKDNITAAFKQQFHDSFEIALQKKESILSSHVVNRGGIQGTSFTINDLGKVEMRPRNAGVAGRYLDTVFDIPEAHTRLALMEDYDLYIPIEPMDAYKLSASPDSTYMQLMVAAANRAKDNLIYRQLTADVMEKQLDHTVPNASGSLNGWTPKTLPSAQKMYAGGDGTKAPVATAGKAAGAVDKGVLLNLRTQFRRTLADQEEIFILYNADMMLQILADETLTNSDYMAVKMLQEGDVAGKWLGMNWIAYEDFDVCDFSGDTKAATGKDFKRTVAFTNTALHFGTGMNYTTDVGTRHDLRLVKQLSAQMAFGAARANDQKIVSMVFGTK